MGDAALHLDLFEQPGRKRVFQHPANTRHLCASPRTRSGLEGGCSIAIRPLYFQGLGGTPQPPIPLHASHDFLQKTPRIAFLHERISDHITPHILLKKWLDWDYRLHHISGVAVRPADHLSEIQA